MISEYDERVTVSTASIGQNEGFPPPVSVITSSTVLSPTNMATAPRKVVAAPSRRTSRVFSTLPSPMKAATPPNTKGKSPGRP